MTIHYTAGAVNFIEASPDNITDHNKENTVKNKKKMTEDGNHRRCQAPTKKDRQCKNPATKMGQRVCGQPAHTEWGKKNLIPTKDMEVLRKYWARTTEANSQKLAKVMQNNPTKEKINMWVNIANNPSYVDEVLNAFRKHWGEVNAFMKKSPKNIDKPIKKDSKLYDWLVEMSKQFDFPAPTGRTVGEVMTALTEGGKAVHNFGATQDMLEKADQLANGIIKCDNCSDSGHCKNHRDDTKVHCNRCAGTGKFIKGKKNDKFVFGPGQCHRCAGKGYHTNVDAKRNWGYDQNN